jgi:hypothetical protein
MIFHVMRLVWHPVGSAQPYHAAAQGQPSRNRCLRRVALSLGWRVVALREAGGMPHPAHLAQLQRFCARPSRRQPACPARGAVLQIDKSSRIPGRFLIIGWGATLPSNNTRRWTALYFVIARRFVR